MTPVPRNANLYAVAEKKVYLKNPVHSAYRSAQLVKKYKLMFKEKYGNSTNPYIGKKSDLSGLRRWFKEEWKSDTGHYKYTSKDSVYRPSKRITKDTPKTFSELSTAEIKKAKRQKKKTGRVSRF
jgi:hypothetical protein